MGHPAFSIRVWTVWPKETRSPTLAAKNAARMGHPKFRCQCQPLQRARVHSAVYNFLCALPESACAIVREPANEKDVRVVCLPAGRVLRRRAKCPSHPKQSPTKSRGRLRRSQRAVPCALGSLSIRAASDCSGHGAGIYHSACAYAIQSHHAHRSGWKMDWRNERRFLYRPFCCSRPTPPLFLAAIWASGHPLSCEPNSGGGGNLLFPQFLVRSIGIHHTTHRCRCHSIRRH